MAFKKKIALNPRNGAFAVYNICFNWRKLWNHKDAGALHQPVLGAHACKSHHVSMVKPTRYAGTIFQFIHVTVV